MVTFLHRNDIAKLICLFIRKKIIGLGGGGGRVGVGVRFGWVDWASLKRKKRVLAMGFV
jgi:hypothetical protein